MSNDMKTEDFDSWEVRLCLLKGQSRRHCRLLNNIQVTAVSRVSIRWTRPFGIALEVIACKHVLGTDSEIFIC
jgi:hypothetical protein